MIRLNVDEERLENGDLIDVVKQIFWYQIFWKIFLFVPLMVHAKVLKIAPVQSWKSG